MSQIPDQKNYQTLFDNLCHLYEDTLQRDNQKNAQTLHVYWQMGAAILSMIGNPGRKSQYGKQLIARLSQDLTQKYGDGFKPRTVRYFRDFASQYARDTLNPAISWSHYRAMLSVTDKAKRRHLEQRIIDEQLSKTELEKIISLSRQQRTGENSFPLTPRPAAPGIFKITEMAHDTEHVIADLGFNVKRQLILPGIQRVADTYVTQISPRKFNTIDIQPGERYCYHGSLLNIIDGDTVKMRLNLHFDTFIDISLRLRGIDAMEIDTKEGQRAKRALSRLLNQKTNITVYTYHHDRYGRYIADLVTSDGTYINKQLVEKGLACFLKM